jgi:hypothetical protein
MCFSRPDIAEESLELCPQRPPEAQKAVVLLAAARDILGQHTPQRQDQKYVRDIAYQRHSRHTGYYAQNKRQHYCRHPELIRAVTPEHEIPEKISYQKTTHTTINDYELFLSSPNRRFRPHK